MNRPTSDDLREVSRCLIDRLKRANTKLVLAESCTAGLVAASLAQVPGTSDVLCGSAVTYRNDTKVRWLQVSRADIDQYTAVSRNVAEQMVRGVLLITPEAELAAAITGHLGPNAPDGQDGEVYIAVGRTGGQHGTIDVIRRKLRTESRLARQREAAHAVITSLLDASASR